MTDTNSVTPPAGVSELTKIWNWIKGKAVIVEEDVAKVLGEKATSDLEAIGKVMLETWAGTLAVSAIADATDVATGNMSVSKAISGLMAAAKANGKALTGAAALQIIALAQNALPTKQDATITPAV